MLADLMARKLHPQILVITLAQNEKNHLEFFSALLLKQHYYDKKELFIVGLAQGYEDAVELVRKITQEVLEETGNTDIREYILTHQKLFEESRV